MATSTEIQQAGFDNNNTTQPQRGPDGNMYMLSNDGNGGRNITMVSGGGGGGTSGGYTVPQFNFDWSAARKKAFDQLTPYYQQKLDLAKGDVELAKKYIEQDYQRGLRVASEDYTANTANEALNDTQETREAQGTANKAGVYVGELAPGQTGAAPTSQYYNDYIGDPMQQKQQARQLAIQRALERSNEVTTETRSKGIEEQDQGFKKNQQDLNDQQRAEAYGPNTNMMYQDAYSKFMAANGTPTTG